MQQGKGSLPVRLAILAGFVVVSGSRPGKAQTVAVGSQYDSSHVYVAPTDAAAFVKCFVGTFGGTGSQPVITTVTPTPSKTTSQILHTPVGLISLFAFITPIPAPFGAERTGYLVTNMNDAVREARAAGADVLVTPFPDPIGIDTVIQWPGGVTMQLYWHTKAPSYPPLQHIPENRVYVSPDRAEAFMRGFLRFSKGKIVSDDAQAPGIEIGNTHGTYRRVQIESKFGNMAVSVTDGHLAYPYGRETTGYAVDDLDVTLQKGKTLGMGVLVAPFVSRDRRSAMVQFPGGYIAEIHSAGRP